MTAVEGMVGAATLSMLNTSPVSLLGLMLTAGSVEERVVSTETVEENKNEEEEEEKKDEGVLLTVDDWLPVRLSVELWAIVRCARSSLFKGLDHFVHSGGNLPKELQREVSLSLILRFKGQFLYTVYILCNVEWRINHLSCTSIILYSVTGIAYNHQTNN